MLGVTKPSLYADAFPEGDAPLDFTRGRQRCSVIPGRARIALAPDYDVVIVGDAFPAADGGVVDRREVLFPYGFDREVLIPFHHDAVVALGDYSSFPRCFWHIVSWQSASSAPHQLLTHR